MQRERLDYIDGLRGVAVLMVVIFHAWAHHLHPDEVVATARLGDPLSLLVSRGYEGVTLFFVLSGFCLSLPLLRARAAGDDRWFNLLLFWRRRCWRILPPYFAALSLMIAASILLAYAGEARLTVIGPPPTAGNLLGHVLLIQNMTPYVWQLNGSFWSLALEWQWYAVFPLVLAGVVWRPKLILSLLLFGAVVWHLETGDLWDVSALPSQLIELATGVYVALLAVEGRRFPAPFLWLAVILGVVIAEVGIFDAFGIHRAFYGSAFGCLILLSCQQEWSRRVLSWRPLVMLGVASYSVYLVHEPIVQAVDVLAPTSLSSTLFLMPSACCLGLAAGVIFYRLVERPSIRWQQRRTRHAIAASPVSS